jgi:hypothetical protein
VTKRAVLAQLSRDTTDEHYPMLIYEKESFGDFKLTTKFKTVGGGLEQMAGVAFRIQDEKNFYVVRASALGNSFRFYKMVNGERSPPIGPTMEIPSGVWHELTLECKGSQIICGLDGKTPIPPMVDASFSAGKIGFWTKSDSISYFYDTKINYTPRVVAAQIAVDNVLKKHSLLLGLKVYAKDSGTGEARLVAGNDKTEIGHVGGTNELDVITNGTIYWSKRRQDAAVLMPLRDRNGDPVAAVRVVMRTFIGQTEQNVLVRAQPIITMLQAQIHTTDDLAQ